MGWQPHSHLSHEASRDVSLLFAVHGVGTLRGDFVIWMHYKSNAMNTQPLCARTHTHTQSPCLLSCTAWAHLQRAALVCSHALPYPQPCSKRTSPHAPMLWLVFLTSLPWQCQARASYTPNCSQADPESFAVAWHYLSSQGRGTSLPHCAAVRSLHGSNGQNPSPTGRQRADRPHNRSLLVTVQQKDRARGGTHIMAANLGAEAGPWGPVLFIHGRTVAAAQ